MEGLNSNFTCFPDFYFPRGSDPNGSLFATDYGSQGSPNIYVSLSGNIEVCLQKDDMGSIQECSPLLPLFMPQDHHALPVIEKQDEFVLPSRNYAKHTRVVESKCYEHFFHFCRDHLDIACQSVLELNSNVNEPLYPHRSVRNMAAYLKKCVKSRHTKAFGRVSTAKQPAVPSFLQAICNLDMFNFDIPKSLLLDCLDEELMHAYDTALCDPSLGNTLVCSDITQDEDGYLLFHPSGPVGDQFCISKLDVNVRQPKSTVKYFTQPAVSQLQKFSLKGRIRNISEAKDIWGYNHIVGLRTSYTLSLLSGCKDEALALNYKPLATVACDKEIQSFDVNRYITGDVLIALADGSFCVWSESALKMINLEADSSPLNCNWSRVLYSSSPRLFVAVNQNEAVINDIRTRTLKSSSFFTLNDSSDGKEFFSPAISLHPDNPHQTYLTTNYSLLLMDDRFLREPLFRYNHHMDQPPQFITTTSCHFGGTGNGKSHIVCLGSYAGAETRCLVVSNGGSNSSTAAEYLRFDTGASSRPPSCSASMMQLGNYRDWIRHIPADKRKSLCVKERLQEPLAGLSVTPVSSNNDCFLVVQISKCGDVFFQYISSSKEELRSDLPKEINTEDLEFYKRWVEIAYNDICQCKDDASANDITCIYTNLPKTVFSAGNITSDSYICDKCKSATNTTSERDRIASDDDDSSSSGNKAVRSTNEVAQDASPRTCTMCRLNSSQLTALQSVSRDSGVITLSKLGMECEIPEFTDRPTLEGSQDLLIKALQENWKEDNYVQLIDFIGNHQDKDGVRNAKQNVTKASQPPISKTVATSKSPEMSREEPSRPMLNTHKEAVEPKVAKLPSGLNIRHELHARVAALLTPAQSSRILRNPEQSQVWKQKSINSSPDKVKRLQRKPRTRHSMGF